MPITPLRRSYALALVPALLAAAACGSSAATDPAGPTVASVAGTYTLKSVAGQPLPAAVTGTSTITQAAQVTRTLTADGTCSESGTYTTRWGSGPPGPVVSTGTVMTCTWTLSGQTATFRLVSNQLPYGGYDATTTATVAADGTLTEQRTSPKDGTSIYPRAYGR